MKRLLVFVSILAFFSGHVYTEGKKKIDPVQQKKNEFLGQYGLFVSSNQKVSYYQKALGVTDKENKIFKNLKTLEDLDKFIEVFWKVRDTNPNTPENEFKENIDQRIEDIENEVMALDGVMFKANGGLKGDMAHIYLFYGRPCSNCIERLPGGRTYVEMMVWYYFDQNEHQLFRFLFYKKGGFGLYQVFKNHMTMISFEYLLDPLISPLREISNRMANTPQELLDIWNELEMNDPMGIFRMALLEFSYYNDVRIDDVLMAPEAASVTAERFKPLILGQPNISKDKNMLYGSRKSFIPGRILITKDQQTGKYSLTAMIRYSDMDWEVKKDSSGDATKDKIEAPLNLRVSFQNLETKEKREFICGVNLQSLKTNYDRNPSAVLPISFRDLRNYRAGKVGETLSELMGQLEPGAYNVDVHFGHNLSRKPLVWMGTIFVN